MPATIQQKEPLEEMIRRAEAGDARACLQVGHLYAAGDAETGIAADREKAVKYYEIGTKTGDVACMFGLAGAHLHNNEIPQAIALLQACATRKHLRSLVVLGDFYLRGQHVTKEPRTAFLYLQEYTTLCCARPPAGNAMIVRWDLVLYPLCLLFGVGCDKDEKAALSVLNKLAELGNLSARSILKTGWLDDPTIGSRFGFNIRETGPAKILNTASTLVQLPVKTGGGAGQFPRLQQRAAGADVPHRLSKFLQKSLIPDEKVILIGEFPRIYTVDAVLRLLFMCWLGLWASGKIPRYIMLMLWQSLSHDRAEQAVKFVARLFTQWPFVPFYVLSFIGAWTFLYMMITKWTTQIVLTDRRFLYKHGLIAVEMIQMNFWQVEHTDVTQSMLGSLLDYGRVVIQSYAIHQKEDSTGDAGLLRLPLVKHPYMFTRVIEDHRRAPPYGYRQGVGPGALSVLP